MKSLFAPLTHLVFESGKIKCCSIITINSRDSSRLCCTGPGPCKPSAWLQNTSVTGTLRVAHVTLLTVHLFRFSISQISNQITNHISEGSTQYQCPPLTANLRYETSSQPHIGSSFLALSSHLLRNHTCRRFPRGFHTKTLCARMFPHALPNVAFIFHYTNNAKSSQRLRSVSLCNTLSCSPTFLG
jgi:hypothetical protein